MAAAGNLYANFLVQALSKNINLTSDSIKIALLGAGYTPNLFTDTHWSDVQANEVSGTGYSAGGVALTGKSLSLVAANSWTQVWTATQGYGYGQIVRPITTNGLVFRCVEPGTTGSSEPTWPTLAGDTLVDGTVLWACLGDAVLVFTSAVPQWTGATFNASYAVLYDAQTGTPSTEPLIALQTFATVQSPSNQTYQVVPDSVLGWFVFSPPA